MALTRFVVLTTYREKSTGRIFTVPYFVRAIDREGAVTQASKIGISNLGTDECLAYSVMSRSEYKIYQKVITQRNAKHQMAAIGNPTYRHMVERTIF